MSEHAVPAIERLSDVVVIGAAAEGLAAALALAQAGRSVIVVGATPGADEAAEEARAHGVELLAGPALAVGSPAGSGGRARVELAGGHALLARRVLDTAATGAAAAAARIDADLADADDGESGSQWSTQADWEHRYAGEQVWSGNPNGSLVVELAGLAPGRALDVGAGEGGDALWLAEQGWSVTATDISERALGRIAVEAARRGLAVECRHADANGTDPFGGATFDLVSAAYASIPRTPDARAVGNLLGAVAPGGTLLLISHDMAAMRAAAADHAMDPPPFDPDAYVRTDDVAHALATAPGWTIEEHGARPRPPGAASAHHVEDIVLRARRGAASGS